MRKPNNPSEDVVTAVGVAVAFIMVLFLCLAFCCCSTIKVNASQVDGTISVTSTPNQPVQVSVTTNLKESDSLQPIVSL